MKQLYIFLIILFSATSSISQHNDLVERSWHLDNLIINGDDNPVPVNSEISFITAIFYWDFDIYAFETVVCGLLFSNSFFTGDDEFEFSEINQCCGTCSLSVNQDYELLYFNFFESNITYAYIIENFNEDSVLTITHPNGDQAIYRDSLLGIDESNSFSFAIYPNPVQDILRIENNSTTGISSIKIYDVLGRLVLAQNSYVNQIDVSHLNSGVLFVKIETDQGMNTKKIIKQ